MAGWPFWAATSDERIEQAFEFAGLQAGEHLVDLGCGDGRVLLRAAALHGARVTGIELDPALAATARALLTDHHVDGEVIEGDFADVDLEGVDVLFAYLSPATLQRLSGPLATSLAEGARVITTGYAVPGWEPVQVGGRCYLYRLPVVASAVDRARRGWESAGVLTSLRPDATSLVAVKLHAEGGPVDIRIADGELAGVAEVRAGVDVAAAGDEVVIDLRFDPQSAGTRIVGALEVVGRGSPPFPVFAVVDAGEPGVWGLSISGCDTIADAFAAGDAERVLTEARASTRP